MTEELATIVAEAEVERFRVMIDARTRHADLWPIAKRMGSVVALANAIGIHQTTVNAWVNLKKVPNIVSEKVARAMESLHIMCGKSFEELWPSALRVAIGEGRAGIRRDVLIDTAMLGMAERARDRLFLPDPSETLARAETRDLLLKTDGILDSVLTRRERMVICMRYGIGYDSPYTLAEAGKALMVSRERIRELQARAENKLRTAAKQMPALQDYAAELGEK